MRYAIEAGGLVKRFGDAVALDGVDLRVTAGQVTAVLGPAGAGKTTLLAVLAASVRPDAGWTKTATPVLLLDEPAADPADDPADDPARAGTVLFTTRDPAQAERCADRIVVLDRGRVLAEGRPGELRRRVGGQILHVHPSVPADTDAITRILTELTGAVPARDAGGLLTVPATDPMLLSALVRRLDAAGVTADELGLRRPTLDEVLAALTGSPE
ncbi:ATP-binding cassette domain-containing protein [Dactylosporangium sp. NPDC006015]|uniref:ATP-binding cassette domain-containing protein n=1 Tax=Dactylosporangium sp. NPDC006015 TaxID=3154576 RepID=UPI0033A5E790